MTTATKTSTVAFIVTGGDNKLALFQQLLLAGVKDGYGNRVERPYFMIRGHLRGSLADYVDHLLVNYIGLDGSSGDEWLIKGDYPTVVPNGRPEQRRRGGKFTGYYNTRTRKGTIEVTFS